MYLCVVSGPVWLVLGVQCRRCSGGSDEEENRFSGPIESAEPAGLQCESGEPRLQRRISESSFSLHHPEQRH